ncbi:HypC/HybG/HupF family hydrogenase formation chaperone [Lentzea nigeriaca]|uniref:HypC/HybG/HupF family hydrogenase formation chaperone n=1 Tax=Lentzea nigeriaca TaxID=1128665 RepID=UPI0019586BAF|nr:HypC/HybG/HupF family hydrogenase formation chaperone [Lentzea nigeriaca]MBM7863839.1 hydrogenase expression/formation protein HypC [Lentzea nigeriaca]
MNDDKEVCREDLCVTCADLTVPGKVVYLLPDDMAVVRGDDGHTWEVSIALVTAEVGDVVLLHAGEAIALLPGGAR